MPDHTTWPTANELLGFSPEQLRKVDPLAMNLIVAKGIPSLASLDIGKYVAQADEWAADIRRRLPRMEAHFHRSPATWKNDIRFFRLGIICWYVEEVLKVTYPDELASAEGRMYADPLNVFVNGLIDRRQGSCANLPVLHVALGWRLGWPVSLSCARDHLFCGYDDGEVIHNIEATAFGRGGFRSHPDDYYREQYQIPSIAVACGSDLRAVTPLEMLGLFVAIRSLHFATIHEMREAELGLLLARHLFPRNRLLYSSQMEVSIECGLRMFDRGESGHPANVGSRLREWLHRGDCLATTSITAYGASNGNNHHAKRQPRWRNDRLGRLFQAIHSAWS